MRAAVALVCALAVVGVAGCSTTESAEDTATWQPVSDLVLKVDAVPVHSERWVTLEAKYVDSKGNPDDAKDGDRIYLQAYVPNLVKGECSRSSVPVDQCYRASFEAAVHAAEKQGDLPQVGCSQVEGPTHGQNGLSVVHTVCKIGWSTETEREYPTLPVAEPIQFDSNGTVWLRIAEDGRDASCTLLRLPTTQECVSATPEQVALIYPRVTDVVGYEHGEGGGWTSGKYLVLRIRGDRS